MRKNDQCCYSSALPMAIDDLVYRGIKGKIIDPDSNDMRTK
jgi:hypothetical protein